MMQLTRFTDLGLRVVMVLGAGGQPRTSTELAQLVGASPTHVAKVITELSRLGVVESRRGRNGGVVLTEEGLEATAGWLARRLEGEAEVVDCEGRGPCPLAFGCRLRGVLRSACEAFLDVLDQVTMRELIATSDALPLSVR